jgi:hypothetical protein
MTASTLLNPTRDVVGKYTAHAHGTPELALLAEYSAHAVTATPAQETTLDRFEQEYSLSRPYLRPDLAGRLIATYVTDESDEYIQEARLDEDGNLIGQYILEMDSRGPKWVETTGDSSRGFADDGYNPLGIRTSSRSTVPSATQSATITAFTANPDFYTSIRSGASGEVVVLSVSADGKRTLRGTVNATGTLAAAAEYKEGADGELIWVPMTPAALKRLGRSGIKS